MMAFLATVRVVISPPSYLSPSLPTQGRKKLTSCVLHLYIGAETCDANNQCQYGVPPTPAPTPCPGKLIEVDIKTDNYPGETSWTMTKTATGSVVGSMAQGAYSEQNTWYPTKYYCDTNNDEFAFTINDSYGDGICCGYGSGLYEIHHDGALVHLVGNLLPQRL